MINVARIYFASAAEPVARARLRFKESRPRVAASFRPPAQYPRFGA